MSKSNNTFVLNDEDKVNSYGFRTLNKGIDLKRFKNNPVILNAHNSYSNSAVIGKWTNIRMEGSQLLADASFDEEDEDAMKIAGKVERGFIKGCSMGIVPDRETFKLEATGKYLLNKSELMEASIVPVPSNANSVKLYATEGTAIEKEEIQLHLQDLKLPETNKNHMDKLVLSAGALVVLGLPSTEDTSLVATAVEKLAEENKSLKEKNVALNANIDAQLKSSATALVNGAVTEGKLTAEVKDEWIKMATANFETVSKTIATMKGTKSLGAMINNGEKKEITVESFQEMSPAEQLSFKNDNPESYAKLFA